MIIKKNEAVVAEAMKLNSDSLEILDMRECFNGADVKFHPGLTKWRVFIEESRDNREKLIELTSVNDPLYEKYKNFVHSTCFPDKEETLKKYGLQNCIRILPQDCDTSN